MRERGCAEKYALDPIALIMEVLRTFETAVSFYQITRGNILEDKSPQESFHTKGQCLTTF
jgi:hypothetical protein